MWIQRVVPSGMQDLETEIFLHLLQQHRAAIAGLAEDAEAAAAKATASSSDGMAPVRWLPPSCHQDLQTALLPRPVASPSC